MLEVRMGCLYTNNCINIKSRFEVLYNINKKALVTDKKSNKQMYLKDYLMTVTQNNK